MDPPPKRTAEFAAEMLEKKFTLQLFYSCDWRLTFGFVCDILIGRQYVFYWNMHRITNVVR